MGLKECEAGTCDHVGGKHVRVMYALQCENKACPEYKLTYTLEGIGPCPACGAGVKVMWSWVEGG